jgi:ssDNA-binding Zn-finger/Zn-ribbon topoisomerase 1
MSDSLVLCPRCGAFMIQRRGRMGVFYGCSAFPRCRGTRELDGRVGWSSASAIPTPAPSNLPAPDSDDVDDLAEEMVMENDPGPAPAQPPMSYPRAIPLGEVGRDPQAKLRGPTSSKVLSARVGFWQPLALLVGVVLVVVLLSGVLTGPQQSTPESASPGIVVDSPAHEPEPQQSITDAANPAVRSDEPINDKPCPICGGPMKLDQGTAGKRWVCDDFPKCQGARRYP